MIHRALAILTICVFALPLSGFAQSQERRKATEVRLTYSDGMQTYYRYHREGNLRLLQSQYGYIPESYQLDTAGQMHLIASDFSLRGRYFVYHKDSVEGYSFDPHQNNQQGTKANVDSILRSVEIQFDDLSRYSGKADSIVWSADGSQLREVFVEPKSDTRPAGRAIFFYNRNLLHIIESFSPELEKGKARKLVRIEFHLDSFYDPKSNNTYPAFFVMDELREVDVENPDLIQGYFEQYRRQTGSNN